MWFEWNTPIFGILVDSSLRALAMTGLVAGILFAARIRSSRLQHLTWTILLGAMMLMPLLSWVIPPVSTPYSDVPSFGVAVTARQSLPVPGTGITAGLPAVSVFPGLNPTAPAKPAVWPTLILAIYGVGVGVLLARQTLGCLAMIRLSRTTTALHSENVFESSALSSPVVCGIVLPRIVLPRTWNEWSPEKLRAVLVHERAHIRSAHPLIAFLARVNCALFWFNPVAWWLERKLATTAEHVCDDAVVRETGEPRRYAALLLEIAEAVHRRGGRLSWQGIGVEGKGSLHGRIDRLLGGHAFQHVSALRKLIVALFCMGTVYLAAACHQDTAKSDEIAQLRQEVAELRTEIRNLGGGPSPDEPKVVPNSRNPFHVPDVPDPDGSDVKAYAPSVNFLGKDDDANAQQWVTGAVATGDRSSIDGDWVGRWDTNGGGWVRQYRAEVRTVADRVYILYRDHQGRFLADLHRDKDLLVGRLVGIDNPADTSLCVIRIVSPERLDGTWDAGIGTSRRGRLDFRRRFK